MIKAKKVYRKLFSCDFEVLQNNRLLFLSYIYTKFRYMFDSLRYLLSLSSVFYYYYLWCFCWKVEILPDDHCGLSWNLMAGSGQQQLV